MEASRNKRTLLCVITSNSPSTNQVMHRLISPVFASSHPHDTLFKSSFSPTTTFLKSALFCNRMSNELKGQQCPICSEKKLTLREEEVDVAHFGHMFIFSMTCDGCKYRKADIECATQQAPAKYTLEVEGDGDLNARVVKSGEATVKIPRIMTIEPGATSEGYITNVEGLLQRVKKTLQSTLDAEDEADNKKKLKNMIKKVSKAMVGREKIKIIISDPTGNSAIISDRAVKGKI
jgi:zinc finger protein